VAPGAVDGLPLPGAAGIGAEPWLKAGAHAVLAEDSRLPKYVKRPRLLLALAAGFGIVSGVVLLLSILWGPDIQGLALGLVFLSIVPLALWLRRQLLSLQAELVTVPSELPIAATDLGPPQAVFIMRNAETWALLLFGLAVGGLGAASWHALYLRPRGDPRPWFAAIAGSLVGLVSLVMGIRSAFTRARVLMYSQGLVVVRRRHTVVCRWDEIETLMHSCWCKNQHDGNRPLFHKLRIGLQNGEQVVFRSYELGRYEALQAMIEAATLELLTKRAAAACAAGAIVHFGSLGASADGIHQGKNLLRWHDIAVIGYSSWHVVIRKEGQARPWVQVAKSKVANVRALVALARVMAPPPASVPFLS
jgi:hypothetical protein